MAGLFELRCRISPYSRQQNLNASGMVFEILRDIVDYETYVNTLLSVVFRDQECGVQTYLCCG